MTVYMSVQALRVSMEEQRARQEDEARQAVAASVTEAAGTVQKMEGMSRLIRTPVVLNREY